MIEYVQFDKSYNMQCGSEATLNLLCWRTLTLDLQKNKRF